MGYTDHTGMHDTDQGKWDGKYPQGVRYQAPIDWPLENWNSHSAGFSPNGAAYGKRWGYVGSWMRTDRYHYARLTDGRTYKQTYSAEFPYRQVAKTVLKKQYVTSPGTDPNKPKYTGMDALVLQALKKRGILPQNY